MATTTTQSKLLPSFAQIPSMVCYIILLLCTLLMYFLFNVLSTSLKYIHHIALPDLKKKKNIASHCTWSKIKNLQYDLKDTIDRLLIMGPKITLTFFSIPGASQLLPVQSFCLSCPISIKQQFSYDFSSFSVQSRSHLFRAIFHDQLFLTFFYYWLPWCLRW